MQSREDEEEEEVRMTNILKLSSDTLHDDNSPCAPRLMCCQMPTCFLRVKCYRVVSDAHTPLSSSEAKQ